MKTSLWLALASLPLAFVLAPRPGSQAAAQSPLLGASAIQFEPVLIYDQAGGTLTGPVRQTLTVYNNGSVRYSELEDDGTLSGSTGRSTYASVSPLDVKLLVRELAAAGADSLPDITLTVSDVPLHTVTFVKKPGTDAKAHSFSFYPFGAYGDVFGVIQAFISAHGLGTGSSS